MVRRVVTLLALAATAGSAHANMGKGWEGGDRAGEPVGIADVSIRREELVIDLRSMTDRNAKVKVSATYHLDNRGADKPLSLVFALGSNADHFRVTLDRTEITSRLPGDAPLPESWQPPKMTPGIDGAELYYSVDNPSLSVTFELVIPSGRHDVAVTYDAEPVQSGDDGVLRYQFGYVLSPARTWAGFGGLDLTVHVPEDWRIAVTPALKRDGDTLRGAFTSVPADAVALTMKRPTGWYTVVSIASLLLFAVVALGGLIVIGWRTRVDERRRRAADLLFPFRAAAFGRGVAWGVAVLAVGMFAIFGPDLTVPGQAYHRGYGQGLGAVGVVLGSILAIVIGWIASHVIGRRVHFPSQD